MLEKEALRSKKEQENGLYKMPDFKSLREVGVIVTTIGLLVITTYQFQYWSFGQ